MSKQTRNILIAVVGVFLAAAVISIIMSVSSEKDAHNIAGQAAKSETAITVNGVELPAYEFKDDTYTLADNLIYFGISVEPDEDGKVLNITANQDGIPEGMSIEESIIRMQDDPDVYFPDYVTCINGEQISSWAVDGGTLIPRAALSKLGTEVYDESSGTYSYMFGDYGKAPENPPVPTAPELTSPEASADTAVSSTQQPAATAVPAVTKEAKIIVLDPGHGKSSGEMSAEEKAEYGWVNNGDGWGEWRHFKYGTSSPDCEGDGCSHRVTPNGACWYPIGNGDRDTEPAINLNNCLAAKAYLEQMGYIVRLTRTTNDENPSITRRLTYCYPNNDTSQQPDADIFLCVHSNAGGGSGSAYIELEGPYDQPTTLGSSEAYTDAGNTLGRYINEEIGANTALGTNSPIGGEPELIAFCKCPVICGYMEIGFFDDPSDLEILNSSSDAIGRSIAVGVDRFVREYMG